jgi:hypothetical protein
VHGDDCWSIGSKTVKVARLKKYVGLDKMEVGLEEITLGCLAGNENQNLGCIDAFIHQHRSMERPVIQAWQHTVISTTHPRRFNPW